MIEPASRLHVLPGQRMRAQELLVHRTTTAAISLAILLTGALSFLASAVNVSGRSAPEAVPAPDTTAALSKAVADYEAAVAAAHPPAAAAAAQAGPSRPLTPPRSAPAPASHPKAVSGGS